MSIELHLNSTYLKRVGCLVALTGDHSDAVDQRDDFGWILLLEFDLRVEQLEPLHSRLAAVVEDQVFAVPSFLRFAVRQFWSAACLMV